MAEVCVMVLSRAAKAVPSGRTDRPRGLKPCKGLVVAWVHVLPPSRECRNWAPINQAAGW